MSSPAPHTHTPPAAPPPPPPYEIKIVSHSNLFYWWPVWAVGLILAFLTSLSGHRMAVVPDGTKAYRKSQLVVKPVDPTVTVPDGDVLVTPRAGSLPPTDKPDAPPDDHLFNIVTA